MYSFVILASPKIPTFVLLFYTFSYFIPTFPKILVLLLSYFSTQGCRKPAVSKFVLYRKIRYRAAYFYCKRFMSACYSIPRIYFFSGGHCLPDNHDRNFVTENAAITVLFYPNVDNYILGLPTKFFEDF